MSPLDSSERDFGPQPLGAKLADWELTNHDLVEISPEQLTHKQVQRAIQGRRLTLKMMQKLARTVNFAIWGRLSDTERESFTEYFPKHLFSYAKGSEESQSDPNGAVLQGVGHRPVRRDFLRELGKD